MNAVPNEGVQRPSVLDLKLDGIPDELKALDRWCGWRWELQPENDLTWLNGPKWAKVPKRVHRGLVGYGAKSNDASTWCTYAEAVAAYEGRMRDESSYLDGIGIMLGDGLHGVDLDKCYNQIEGFTPKALATLDRIDGYAEKSPSGTGVKIITRTNLTGSRSKRGVELYTGARWFAITGHRVNGHDRLPEQIQSLDWLLEQEWGEGAAAQRRAAPQILIGNSAADPLRMLQVYKAPHADWPLEKVKAELLSDPEVLDASMGYQEWIRVGQALHHQGGGEPEWLDAWIEWSASAPGHFTPGLCEDKWPTFGMREAGGADPRLVVTLASLLKETEPARTRKAARAAAVLVDTLKAAPVSAADPAGFLVGNSDAPAQDAAPAGGMKAKFKLWRAQVEGAAALKDTDAGDAELERLAEAYSQDAAFQSLLQLTVRDLDTEGFVNVFAKALKKVKSLARTPTAEARSMLSGGPAVLPAAPAGGAGGTNVALAFAVQNWVFDMSCDKYVDLHSGTTCSAQGFEGLFKQYMPIRQDGTRGPVVEQARQDGSVRYVAAMTYHPMGEPVFTYKDKEFGNLYRAASVPASRRPETEDDWQAIREVQDHFAFLLPAERERGLLMSWIAWNIRRPGDKVLWMPFVQGVPGAGKSSIFDLLVACMGEDHVKKASNEELHSDYNPWKMGAAVRVLDELKQRSGGQNAAWSLIEKLREPIVDSTITVVAKNKGGIEMPNVTNYIAFSEYRDALPLTKAEEERRLCLLFSPVTAAEVLERQQSGGYKRFRVAVERFAPVLRWWFGSGEWMSGAFEMYPEFDAKGRAPMTAAKVEVAEESRSDSADLVVEALAETGLGIGADVVSVPHLRLRLVNLAKAYALHAPSPKGTAAILRDMGWLPHKAVVRVAGKYVRAWTRQKLEAQQVEALLAATVVGTAVLA